MKLLRFISVFALAAGLFVSCTDPIELKDFTPTLTPAPASAMISASGTAAFTFTFQFLNGDGVPMDLNHYTATINFEAVGGTVSPASATTDKSGTVTVTFTAPNPESFTGGTVKGTVIKVKGDKSTDGHLQQGNLAVATAEVLPMSSEEPISKAEKLKDNVYVVQKTGDVAREFPLSQSDSRWYVGRSYTDKTQQAIKVELMDEDPQTSTMGWSMAELPLEIANKLTTINQEFYQKYPWAAMKFGTFRTGADVNAHIGASGGNVKLDGSSQIWLKEKSGTKGYTGQYQLLFVFVFTNYTWNSETQTEIPGDEYTIYGNATVEQDFPTLSYFSMTPATDWVQVGKSIKVEADWTDGADFDMGKVKLVGQTAGHSSSQDEDEGYFRWDASSSTITALKSSGNTKVYLKFRYEGTEMATTCQVATGPGWDFTSFSLDPARLVMDKYDVMPLTIGEYGPMNLGSWDWAAIEIDPASNSEERFYYDGTINKLYNFSGKAGETYNLRFRIRSNYSVSAPLEVYVVEQKPYSFTITYLHNNDYIHDDNIHGVCNYGMGLSLGVITNPVDCYWNWADVELVPGYDNGFSFSGAGGRDDHPKLIRTTSNPSGGTSLGVQMIFRLKYDHSITSTIYIDHN
ncbi:MAG: hypothetical protein J5769_05365 [Bacteroidales bacterium]|nr:hypothetical protein [Bacteroidales bacterium]